VTSGERTFRLHRRAVWRKRVRVCLQRVKAKREIVAARFYGILAEAIVKIGQGEVRLIHG